MGRGKAVTSTETAMKGRLRIGCTNAILGSLVKGRTNDGLLAPQSRASVTCGLP